MEVTLFRMVKLLFLVFVFIIVLFNTVTKAHEEFRNGDLVTKINIAQNLWKAGHNVISNKGIEHVKRLLGVKLPENEDLNKIKDIEIVENIPRTFDGRTHWSKCKSISSIKDQGECGSCWAVAAASAASDRLCIQSNFKTQVNLSAENLMACCRACSDDGGCNGGYPSRAWTYIQSTGLVTGGDYGSKEGCQPYAIKPVTSENLYTPRCYKTCTNKKYGHSYKGDKHYGKSSYAVPQNVAKIQSEILKNGPVEAAFAVYADFMHYASGVYIKTSDDFLGNHAVRIIGWGTENKVNYWLVANSWSTEWGDNGLFKIRRGTNECSFEQYITAGLMKN